MVRFRTPALVHAGRIAGAISFVGGAVAWLWLGLSPNVAGRIGDLSLFGVGYLALGIVLNLVAAFILARLSGRDGLQFWLPFVAMTSTVTLFSGESPLGVGSLTAATVLVPLILVQGACALVVLDAEQVRRNTSQEVVTSAVSR